MKNLKILIVAILSITFINIAHAQKLPGANVYLLPTHLLSTDGQRLIINGFFILNNKEKVTLERRGQQLGDFPAELKQNSTADYSIVIPESMRDVWLKPIFYGDQSQGCFVQYKWGNINGPEVATLSTDSTAIACEVSGSMIKIKYHH